MGTRSIILNRLEMHKEQNMSEEFTHFDSDGNAFMVDVSGKDVTKRMAIAQGTIRVSKEVMDAILGKKVKKGDVLTVAQVAGIMGTKRTSELIPMCHILNLTNAKVTFTIDREECTITAFCTVKTEGKTGVEMEALTGASIACLTIYDMCKAIDKRMVIENIPSRGEGWREERRLSLLSPGRWRRRWAMQSGPERGTRSNLKPKVFASQPR